MIYALCFAINLLEGDSKIEKLILKLREEDQSATELAKTFNRDRSTNYRLSNV